MSGSATPPATAGAAGDDPENPSTREGRRNLAFRLLKTTWRKLGQSPLGRMQEDPEAWLARAHPDLLAKIEAARYALDKADDDYLGLRIDRAAFNAAGRDWMKAWLEAAVLAEKEGMAAPEPPPPEPPPPPPEPEFDPGLPCTGCGRKDWVATRVWAAFRDPEGKRHEVRYCPSCAKGVEEIGGKDMHGDPIKKP